jgi:hypothetical protein
MTKAKKPLPFHICSGESTVKITQKPKEAKR